MCGCCCRRPVNVKEEGGQFGYCTGRPKHTLLHWNFMLHPDIWKCSSLSFYTLFHFCRICIPCISIWNISLKYIVAKCAMLQKCKWFCDIIFLNILHNSQHIGATPAYNKNYLLVLIRAMMSQEFQNWLNKVIKFNCIRLIAKNIRSQVPCWFTGNQVELCNISF